uniref:Transposase-associated domain-containing protein n=1 Tax=Brassica oleracea var. oleracea TaxID=109376 RepID=A0A0D3C4P5_BRAOL
MSSSNYYRSWIDRPHLDLNTRLLTEEYQRGITKFMRLVQRQPEAETCMLRCPCSNCKNRKIIKEWDVWTHLYLNGFTRSYKIWYHHGETDYEYGITSEPQPAVRLEEPIRMNVDYGVGTEQMVSAGMNRGETFDDWIREMERGPERTLQYYDPFILASQTDQVCYIKYPRVRNKDDLWVTVTSFNPRGQVQGSSELEDPLQPSTSGNLSAAEDLAAVSLVVDLTDFGEEAVVHVEDEPEIGEFH